jgi:isocitrate/isopropylmalate dehydrogenase
MSGVMMLEHIHEDAIAERVRHAYEAVLREAKHLTRDLGGHAGTDEFAEAIIAKLR